jgi:hypothetical protein
MAQASDRLATVMKCGFLTAEDSHPPYAVFHISARDHLHGILQCLLPARGVFGT